jgi:hypothetical protein
VRGIMVRVIVDRRAERRKFIRAQHPDRGGDPDAFVAGLRSFEEHTPVGAASSNQVHVTAFSVPPWPVSLVTVLLRKFRKPRRRVR